MATNIKLQESNLAFFLAGTILPEIEGRSEQVSLFLRPLALRKAASQFECVAWLNLGVAMGYFDRVSSNALLERHFEALLPKNRIDVESVRDLFSDLPELFESYRVNNSLEANARISFKQPERLLSPFRSLHLLATSWARDSVSQAFTVALNFLPDKAWERIARRTSRIDPAQLLLALNVRDRSVAQITTETVCTGFLLTLEHLASSREVFRNLAARVSEQEVEAEDFLQLRRAVRHIQFWRVNLKQRGGRFRELSELITAELGTEIRKREFRQDVGFFRQEVESLMEYWLKDDSELNLKWSVAQR